MLIQQLEQLRSLPAGWLALWERQVQKRFALWGGLLQAARGRGMECLALELEQRFPMRRIEHWLTAVIGALMTGNLHRAIEDAHQSVGSRQSQRAPDGFRRNGVIVKVEAYINGLVRAHGLDAVGTKEVQRRRQEPRLFLGEELLDGVAILSRPAPLMRDLIAPSEGLAIAFGQRGEGTPGPEGIPHIADGPLHAPFGEKRALQIVLMVAHKFSPSHIDSTH